MEPNFSLPLMVLGVFFLVGFAAHVLGQRTHVPRVTLLLMIGALAGPRLLHLVPDDLVGWFPYAAQIALSIVGFLLGERFLGKRLRKSGRSILLLTFAESVFAAIFVFLAVWAVGGNVQLALLLAGVAPPTAPAATLDLIREARARGPVTDAALEIVAIDDAIGILLFSFLSVLAGAYGGEASSANLLHGLWEIGGGIGIGLLFGFPMAWVTGRARPGELTLVETLGFVLICSGLASYLGASYLLSCMVMGAVVANRARHHTRPFHAIENISQPFLIAFFLLAGFEFDPQSIPSMGLVGIAYIVSRAFGKAVGVRVGVTLTGGPAVLKKYLAWCLLPQAGVALGLGLLIARSYPEFGSEVLTLLVGTTFVFELSGPLLARRALMAAGEIPRPSVVSEDSTPPS
jgi:Kef-type K+ transport system membrane component KefB